MTNHPSPGSAPHNCPVSPKARRSRGPGSRIVAAARLLVLSSALLAAVGAVGHGSGWVMLTATLGPTAYIILAHPDSVQSRLKNGAAGHLIAVATGLAFLAAFGLWNHPSVIEQKRDTAAQIGAQALAVGVTLFLLTVLDRSHPPAAATALLITSGIARPGPPLYGMLIGLAAVLLVAPLLARAPGWRWPSERGSS